jgi:4'-phosphopantetheinyl transferase
MTTGASGVIEVWSASTAAGEPPSADQTLLSDDERRRAARFYFDKDRDLFVLGKRMTRTLLGRALGLPPAALVFEQGSRGKPELSGAGAGSGWVFNLAHSGTYVFVALGCGRRLGVDVERERPDMDLVELGRRFFCPREIALLEAGPESETRRLFFKFWTLKEAYLKAEGSGLSISLTAMDASGVPDAFLAPPCAPVEDQPRGILVQRLEAPAGYAAAVAADGGAWRTEVRAWRAEDCAGAGA